LAVEVDTETRTVNPAGSPKLTKKTPFENFENLATKLLKVPKEEVDEKLAECKETRRRKQD
jgi:hypothetical protein